MAGGESGTPLLRPGCPGLTRGTRLGIPVSASSPSGSPSPSTSLAFSDHVSLTDGIAVAFTHVESTTWSAGRTCPWGFGRGEMCCSARIYWAISLSPPAPPAQATTATDGARRLTSARRYLPQIPSQERAIRCSCPPSTRDGWATTAFDYSCPVIGRSISRCLSHVLSRSTRLASMRVSSDLTIEMPVLRYR